MSTEIEASDFTIPEGKTEKLLIFFLEELYTELQSDQLFKLYTKNSEGHDISREDLIYSPEHNRMAQEILNNLPIDEKEFLNLFRNRFKRDILQII